MNVLIIEDEERAANRLELLLKESEPTAEVIAKIASIGGAVEFLKQKPSIQLILSDIQLEDGLSFDIFEQVEVPCPIIFTTAYDQYAIEAFQTNGIDYLLKPVDSARLKQALVKMKRLSPQVSLDNILALANYSTSRQKFKTRFMIKVGERINSIGIDTILAFFSRDNATYLMTKEGRSYPVDYSLEHIEKIIDPEQFFRVNRKYCISIDACNDIIAWSNSRLKIQISTINDEIVVARDRVLIFKDWLDR